MFGGRFRFSFDDIDGHRDNYRYSASASHGYLNRILDRKLRGLYI